MTLKNETITPAIAELNTIYVSVEVSRKSWIVGLKSPTKGLSLPRRDRHGEVYWPRPSVSAVTGILKNPAYAGAFVYGRTRMRQSNQTQGRQHKTSLPMSDWRIVVKDKYPAYVTWETFEKVQSILRDNRADYLRVKGRGALPSC